MSKSTEAELKVSREELLFLKQASENITIKGATSRIVNPLLDKIDAAMKKLDKG